MQAIRWSNATVDYQDSEGGLSEEEFIARARGKDILITQVTDRLSRPVLQAVAPKLIAQLAVGYDNIDLPAATELGILVANTPGVVTESTADLAFGLLLAAARRIAEGHHYIHSGQWHSWTMGLMVGRDIHNRTLGILGMGQIGQAMARRAAGFGMRVLYHNRQPIEGSNAGSGAQWVSKDDLLREADFLTIHVPLSAATRHIIGETELRAMRPDAILINTSRGPVVDESALARALTEKWIAGAGLDVFEDEPRIHPALLAHPGVVVTPHIGGASRETRAKMAEMVRENVTAFIAGRRPPNLLNPGLWT